MKTCTKCKTTKDEVEFSRDKSKPDGLNHRCKQCFLECRRSKNGLIAKIYISQRGHSKKRSQSMPSYSKQELHDWLMSNPLFHVLYDNWKRLDYQKMYIPSIDRKDDNVGYTMDNIQLMTWKENKQKGHNDMRSGKLKNGSKPQKPVFQLTADGVFIAKYASQSEAQRQTGFSQKSISKCCRGEKNSAGGFNWEFSVGAYT